MVTWVGPCLSVRTCGDVVGLHLVVPCYNYCSTSHFFNTKNKSLMLESFSAFQPNSPKHKPLKKQLNLFGPTPILHAPASVFFFMYYEIF